ncbi:tol-pal system-associated acyl-CoA thioesterase [Pseudoxanthomonas suwonensis]|jgi:tol-pal system-associated acyl-CoA thioesterase|uniref:tol-pal system-associated acyl-CoA thioesterase n=2 Tax=Pseudoxanthomonas TaxID=83618 RepID=UPI000568895D|nr:tol-pal system-associated acyl-CoA thioesterase [Pseudoxanthomonas suwonensis]
MLGILSGTVQTMFSIPIRVYWEDTDAGGVVYHARYVAFLERARSDALRAMGRGQQALQQAGLVFAVHSMRLDFLRPARLDDLLEVTAEISRVGRASVVFSQRILRGDEVLLAAEVKVASLRAADFRPCPIEETLYQELQRLQAGPTP